jgi:hypothetical protein
MKKSLFIIVLLFCGMSQLSAQIESYKGKLLKKTWTKSMESYCAGGSDYFILKMADNQSIILDISAWSPKKIATYLQKDIELKGTWRTETKDESQNDPRSQHPTTPTMCRIFVVKK